MESTGSIVCRRQPCVGCRLVIDQTCSPDNPSGQFLTGDENLVNVEVAIDYAVGDEAADLDSYVAQKDRVDGVISRETEAALGEWISGETRGRRAVDG